ncbi:glycerophosphodiester phosphodiesterase [Saccharibacillus alkalitolerans]|uniref:Glycerophosphodiester phosphodiesterase n=1 Tax=Saccharibacillus alkalitolerans TaxID=2705290 RepID=A0ABX0F995_9BACL|nr:glycerophosphodiester phosphodiesterase [Saccharibacillus alkalitolerans]NGZ76888.1 glycerophosphodiester phosphodiesterase [Saccharibacillus alkalitolerans]
MREFPLITAHTGCMGHPAHSLESLCAALKLGCDVYEDDIRVTRDGVPVLAHDDEMPLAGGRRGSLAEMTLEELNDASTAPVLELADMLGWIRTAGRVMNLDIKSDEALEPAFSLVKRLEMTERVFLSGCGYGRALLAERSGISLRKLLNVDIDSFLHSSYGEAVRQACEEGRSAGCFGLNVPYQAVRPELLDAARRNGLAVYVWTVAEAGDMRRMAEWGVDSITTRDPALLLSVREEMTKAEESMD